MKKLKLFCLLLIGLVSMVMLSCQKDEISPDDINTETPIEIIYTDGTIVGTYKSDINSIKRMNNTDIVHSIPSMDGTLKSTTGNYVLIQNNDGTVDTLSLSDDASITIAGINEIYPINDDFLLFEKENGGITVTYEILSHEYTTVYDSIPADETTPYTIVDTTFVGDEMWFIYYDTIDVIVNTSYIDETYANILYNLTDGTFHDLVDDIDIYNDKITKSFNDPFYKNSNKSKFYYYNGDDVKEVDLSSGVPVVRDKYDPYDYSDSFLSIDIFDDNVIYKDGGTGRYNYVTKNGTQGKLDNTLFLGELGTTVIDPVFTFLLGNDLYFVIPEKDYGYIKLSYNETEDSIIVSCDSSMTAPTYDNVGFTRKENYEFSDNNFNYYFDRSSNVLVTLSKNGFEYIENPIGIGNVSTNINQSVELQTKMTKFVNGFVIYTVDGIYSVSTDTKSKSSSSVSTEPINTEGYRIKDMTTDENGNVVFYGKNPEDVDIMGVIDASGTITETLVEYDSNGALITDL
jgi:hypothetical protein